MFISSEAPDITEGLPVLLTAGGTAAYEAFSADERFDIALNGLGYLLRATEQNPYQRAGEQIKKQQIDTSPEAGEQTLTSWWTRSQTSWHLGAGIKWYEPGSVEETEFRFATSQGVNVWTQGELSLLPKTTAVRTGLNTFTSLLTCRRGGVDGYVSAEDANLRWTGVDSSTLTATTPSAGLTQPARSGSVVWAGHAGGVSKWDLAGAGTLTTPLTSGSPARVWWAKSRMFVALGASLYEAFPSDAGTVEADTNLLFTHPDPTWVWTDVAETSDAVLATGFAESESVVYAFSLTDADPLPVLGGARQVALLPPGEQAHCLGAYLGAYVVLGTTQGVRVGVLSQGGSLTYGPVTVPTVEPVTDVTFDDRFAYLGVTRALPDGTSGVVRVDLSAAVGDSGLFAWAYDVTGTSDADLTGVCLIGNTGRVVFAAGGNVFESSATELVPDGWVESGRIRYATTELKLFRFARLNGILNNGRVDVTAIDPAGTEHRVVAFDATTGVDGEAAISVPGESRLPDLAFRIYLHPVANKSPLVSGFSVKSLPSVRKARLYQFPLSCFDWETTRQGDRVGYDGSAWHRVVELEALEDRSTLVQVRDRRTGEAFVGVIESVEFSAVSSPDRAHSNFGGTVLVTVRRV